MIVTCKNCGKEYNVRDNQVIDENSKFKCAACGHVTLIGQPEPAPKTEKVENSSGINDNFKKTIRFGLIFKVVSLMLIVSLVPLVSFWAISFTRSNALTRNDTQVLFDQISKGLAEQVDEWIDKNVRSLNTLANMADIQSMNQQKQEPLLKALNEAYPWTYLVFTTDTSGQNIARNDGKPLTNYSDRGYIKQVMSGKLLGWQTLIGKTSKKPALVLAVPIKRSGRVVGVLASAMAIDEISERIATWRRGDTGYAFLVDETNKVVAHQINDYTLTQKDMSAHPMIANFRRGKTGIQYFTNEKGEACIGSIHPTQYGWGLAIQQNEKEVFQALEKAQKLAYAMLIVTIVVVSLVAYLLGRAIVVPIRKLTDLAERISTGELDAQIEIRSKDEIAALGYAISRLQDSVRLSIERFSRRRRSR